MVETLIKDLILENKCQSTIERIIGEFNVPYEIYSKYYLSKEEIEITPPENLCNHFDFLIAS